MNNSQAADIVEYLVGAYPGTYFKGPTAEVFVNSLMTCDFQVASQAAKDWVGAMDRFPTIAELNGSIRRIRERENQDRQLAKPGYVIAEREVAAEAFSRGYIRARTEAGESMETIQPKLDRLLKQWKLDPTSEREPLERTGSAPRRGAPSRHLPGYLRSSSAPAVDQPAFDGSSIDEPW